MANPFVHVELATNDVAKAKAFYGKLFDWKMEDVPMEEIGTYTMISVGEGTGGGMLKNPMPDGPSMWMSYVLVDDIRAATKKAASTKVESTKAAATKAAANPPAKKGAAKKATPLKATPRKLMVQKAMPQQTAAPKAAARAGGAIGKAVTKAVARKAARRRPNNRRT